MAEEDRDLEVWRRRVRRGEGGDAEKQGKRGQYAVVEKWRSSLDVMSCSGRWRRAWWMVRMDWGKGRL